jgi:hypothetical protein
MSSFTERELRSSAGGAKAALVAEWIGAGSWPWLVLACSCPRSIREGCPQCWGWREDHRSGVLHVGRSEISVVP